jgi:hypothetical protein
MAHAVSQEGNLNHEGASVDRRIDTNRMPLQALSIGPKPPEFVGPTGSDEARPLIEIRLVDAARVLSYEQDPAKRAKERQRVRQLAYGAYMDGSLRMRRDQQAGSAHETITAFVDGEIERHMGAIAAGIDQSLFAEQRDAAVHTGELLAAANQEVASLRRQASETVLRSKRARDYLQAAGVSEAVLRVFDEVSGLGKIFREEAAAADGLARPADTKVLDTGEKFGQIVGQDGLGAAPTSGDVPITSPIEHAA